MPSDRFLDPLLEIILRHIAEILTDLRDVRPTVTNITLALRTEDWLQTFAKQFTEHRIHLIQARSLARRNIIRLASHLMRCDSSKQVHLNNILHIDKVARLLPVAVDRR